VDLCTIAQMIQDDAWLDPGEASLRVEFQNLVHVLREIQDDRDITTLSGRLVPDPRGSTGAPTCGKLPPPLPHLRIACTTSPIGICR